MLRGDLNREGNETRLGGRGWEMGKMGGFRGGWLGGGCKKKNLERGGAGHRRRGRHGLRAMGAHRENDKKNAA